MNSYTAAVTALALTACSAHPAPATAQAEADDPPTIQVSATAVASRAPDQARIQLAVETVAATAGEASEENAARMDAVLAAIRGLGVPAEQIRTQRLELQPRYDRRPEAEQPEITGYRAVNQVSVRLHDVVGVGEVVDAAVEAGANRVTGIEFEISDPAAAYHEALREAIDRARAEAEVAATALDRRLGEPIQVSTGGYSPPSPVRRDILLRAQAEAAPPVEPGEVEVRASVSITWRLGT